MFLRGPSKRGPSKKLRWVPQGDSVSIAGRNIGGLVYVGAAQVVTDRDCREQDRAFIDPALAVARSGADKSGSQMSYWPGYSSIPPQCRAAYLDWLADGRADISYGVGYMFLYFYGLERRFLIDRPGNAEGRQILQEALRLQQLYEWNGSARRYLGAFVQIANIVLDDPTIEQPGIEQPGIEQPGMDYAGWDMPLTLKVAIGKQIMQGEPLSGDWVLRWLLYHPERRLRMPASRCAEEFKQLFEIRFREKHPGGVKLFRPQTPLVVRYDAASSEFSTRLEVRMGDKPIPDISTLRKPVKIAQAIADGAMDELGKFSRYLGRNPEGRGSLEARALLPMALWDRFPSEDIERLKVWASGIVKRSGRAPIADVVACLEGARPDKISKRQIIGVADALARIGVGLAPDPRFALRMPKIEEPVVLFDLCGAVEQLEDVSSAFRWALLEIAVGVFIAQADEEVPRSEQEVLATRIVRAAGVTGQERRRLAANLGWLLLVPPDMALLQRRLKDAGAETRATIRAMVVSVAHADGVVRAEEVAGIEEIYAALGLDPASAYSDLHAGDSPDAPVRVQAARPGAAGEPIPAETAGPGLDTTRIAAIQSDTARAAAVLGEIFGADGDAEAAVEDAEPAVLAGLDNAHTALAREVIARDHWTEEEFLVLCGRHRLIALGALEAVNEWSFETYNAGLLDVDDDGYSLDSEIAAALQIKFEDEKKDRHV